MYFFYIHVSALLVPTILSVSAHQECFFFFLQNYVTMSGVRYVDLGLGTHRVKCRINPNFRLVLIAEDQVTERFPI